MAGTTAPPTTSPSCEHGGRRRRERGSDGDEPTPTTKATSGGPSARAIEPLKSVHVGDDPRQQVAATVLVELRRRERLDPLVEARANAAEPSQCVVVRDQPLGVACERLREAKETHGDDRDGEGEDRRALRRARDQVARAREQRNAEPDRANAEQDPQRDPPGGDPKSATSRLTKSAPAPLPRSARLSSRTTRSADAATYGSCAMTRIVHAPRERLERGQHDLDT